MKTASARFERRVTLLAPLAVKDPRFNTAVKSWGEVATVFAQVLDMPPANEEALADGVDLRQRPCRIRIRWRADVTADMRVRYQGRVLEIVGGPAELGRRELLELLCQEVSTLGDGA